MAVWTLGPRVLSAGTASHVSSPHKHAPPTHIQMYPGRARAHARTHTHLYIQSFLCYLKDMTQFIHSPIYCYSSL